MSNNSSDEFVIVGNVDHDDDDDEAAIIDDDDDISIASISVPSLEGTDRGGRGGGDSSSSSLLLQDYSSSDSSINTYLPGHEGIVQLTDLPVSDLWEFLFQFLRTDHHGAATLDLSE